MERFAFKDNEDVVNTTPGSLYSTAVLFPRRKEVELSPSSGYDADEPTSGQSQSEDDDLYSLSQRFPCTIGVSCCLDSNGKLITADDVSITISGRYYTKVPSSEYTQVIIRIQESLDSFNDFFKRFSEPLSPFFSLAPEGVSITKVLSNSEYSDAKDILLDINRTVCQDVASEPDGILEPCYESIKPDYRFLKSYKEKLWGKLRQIKDGKYLTETERDNIVKRIGTVERYETFISYLEDALSLCDSKSFGFWISHAFSKSIDLSGFDFNTTSKKIIYKPCKYEALSRVVSFPIDDHSEASLSVWLQITKSHLETDATKRYLKIQLENTSDPFQEDEKHYFSIVTEKVNQRCFFGVEIKVESDLLAPYRSETIVNSALSNDVDQLNFLYRSIKDYGMGHLCSADWQIGNNKKWVKSEFIPTYETPDIEPIPRNKYDENYVNEEGKLVPHPLLSESKSLQFKWLSTFSDASNSEIITGLYQFVDTYGQWINALKDQAGKENPQDREFADHNIAQCEHDYRRIRSNMEFLLDGNDRNIDSFRLMNSAMFFQLWHSKNQTKEKLTHDFYRKASDHIYGNASAAWRPFQLAFILLNLDGIIQCSDDEDWYYRNELVDLVWFPTGGGKTEAYLGIIAFTIINRRKTEQNGGGTTAIMRYTLRLLATQQFQRAMRVIFAMEQLRRWDKATLGEEPISIGLFVGQGSLPNSAKELLSECLQWNTINNGKRRESQIPLDRCPWCGELLEHHNTGSGSAPKIKFRCKNVKCAFSDELPIMLCDEYIYSTPPTLLFGTVDKFAALGHKVSTMEKNKDSRRLFGRVMGNLPPDLIIQDELHLLLGPLGSAVSLFECAVDQLCSYTKTLPDGKKIIVRPKIISSTATTRNTELQIRALYDRGVNIFPKNGLDYDDSFFAFYKREKIDGTVRFVSKRKYMGILPTGRTQMTAQMRLIAIMFVHRALFEKEHADKISEKDVEKAMDFFHSTIAYFNSLKEVGKTDAQFYTEYTKYTRRLFKRVLRYSNMLECLYGYDSSFNKSELTGRLSGAEVVKELEDVSSKWEAGKRLPHQNGHDEWLRGTTPPDLILATNMISVGLDVERFNTIIMNSMPRNIAEYIQASSRVARNDLGLVVTLHNPFRARDLSHFERFREFHEKLYYYVEPISITPFSKKSVAKYFPLYLATMIRHTYDNLANATDAAKIDGNLRDNIIHELGQYFDNRLTRTQQLEDGLSDLLTEELEKFIRVFLSNALDGWQSLADGQNFDGYELRYSGSDFLNSNSRSVKKHRNLFLALDAYQDSESENMWPVPMSLRNVESEAVIHINER